MYLPTVLAHGALGSGCPIGVLGLAHAMMRDGRHPYSVRGVGLGGLTCNHINNLRIGMATMNKDLMPAL